MKTNNAIFFTALSTVENQQLTKVVAETITTETDLQPLPSKKFTAADLWKVQRNRKTATARRASFAY
ncbi:MAG: hypothetical protein EAZ47_06395 [Bacteroidetes bacterium]|nr:MAG: hypothetical protein EAY72_04720 [Bacteroidota bacterium]TAE72483.1 MAG: hypothetical protein EAY68_01125 [Bacteroidota bacterium]TAF93503.1 MAG: hypothetical protein EAZ47_06395 [Bacteroidota bacterium]